MTEINLLKNWITIAIQQPVDDQSEKFYFDRKTKEFFSILILDYFLIDKHFKILEGISVYYTKEELITLRDRIKRISSKKASIIALPRCGILHNSEEIHEKILTFLTTYKINLDTAKLVETLQKEPVSVQRRSPVKVKNKAWWKIW